MHSLYAGKHLEFTNVEVDALAHRRQYALSRTGCAMHRKAHLDQMVGDLLDLVVGRALPHRHNHDFRSSPFVFSR